MFRKSVLVILLLTCPALSNAQVSDPWRMLGETLRSEGLQCDVDSLFSNMAGLLSFEFRSEQEKGGTLYNYISNYSAIPTVDEIREGAPMLMEYINSKYSSSVSEKGLIAKAELGYFGRLAGIDSLLGYAYTAYKEAFEKGEENFLALYYSVNDRRYVRSPFVILGDVMLQNGHPDYAQSFYRQAYPLDVFSLDYLHTSNPENIFNNIWNSFDGIEMYKATYSYPLHMERLAKAAFLNGEADYEAYLNEAFYYAVERLFRSFISLDVFEQERLISLYSPIFASQYGNTDTGWAYDAALFIKGCSNSLLADIREEYLKEEDDIRPDNYELYAPRRITLDERRKQIKSLYPKSMFQDYLSAMETYRLEPTDSNKQAVRNISNRIQSSLTFSKSKMPSLSYTYKDVQRWLRPEEGAIEFVRTVPLDGGEPEYHALILTGKKIRPQRVFLCKESQLKDLIGNDPVGIYEKNSTTLYELVWNPVLKYLDRISTVYYSTDGIISLTNMEAAMTETGRRVFEMFDAIRLSSTKEILDYRRDFDSGNAVLYGGLTYHMSPKMMIAANSKYGNKYAASRGLINSADRKGWADLPGTKKEVERIAGIMSQESCACTLLTRTEGTEESFKHLSWNSPNILHLATHGFFLSGEESDVTYLESLALADMETGLRRSGLILSGGQSAWLGEKIPTHVEDGILLSEEIANLNLSNTRLAVLSACETALGSISEEGVDGLQKVFIRAGADNLILSLWKINDEATMQFMEAFYRTLFSSHDIIHAFREAQKYMYTSEMYSDPYFWAGFILIG